MTRVHVTLACLVLILISASSDSFATQILFKSPEQLGSESTLVVRGTVESVRSYWNEERTTILTETRIRIDDTYKGVAGTTVAIVQYGGVVDHVKVSVAGAVSWQPEEEALLYLEPFTSDTYQVTGFSQGKLNIVRGDRPGEIYVQAANLDGVELVGGPQTATKAAGTKLTRLENYLDRSLGDARTRRAGQ